MSGYGASFVLRLLMKGKSVRHVERAFWTVVMVLVAIGLVDLALTLWFPSTPSR